MSSSVWHMTMPFAKSGYFFAPMRFIFISGVTYSMPQAAPSTPGGGQIMAPGLSTLPVIWNRAVIAWPAPRDSRMKSTATPHWTMAPSAVPSMRAASRILSAGTQVISSTRSGV